MNNGQSNIPNNSVAVFPKIVNPDQFVQNEAYINRMEELVNHFRASNQTAHQRFQERERLKNDLQKAAEAGEVAKRRLEEMESLEKNEAEIRYRFPQTIYSRLLPLPPAPAQNNYTSTATIEEVRSPPPIQSNMSPFFQQQQQQQTSQQRGSNSYYRSHSSYPAPQMKPYNAPVTQPQFKPYAYTNGSQQAIYTPQTQASAQGPSSSTQATQNIVGYRFVSGEGSSGLQQANQVPIGNFSSLDGALGQRTNTHKAYHQPSTTNSSAGAQASTSQRSAPTSNSSSNVRNMAQELVNRMDPHLAADLIAKISQKKQFGTQPAANTPPETTSVPIGNIPPITVSIPGAGHTTVPARDSGASQSNVSYRVPAGGAARKSTTLTQQQQQQHAQTATSPLQSLKPFRVTYRDPKNREHSFYWQPNQFHPNPPAEYNGWKLVNKVYSDTPPPKSSTYTSSLPKKPVPPPPVQQKVSTASPAPRRPTTINKSTLARDILTVLTGKRKRPEDDVQTSSSEGGTPKRKAPVVEAPTVDVPQKSEPTTPILPSQALDASVFEVPLSQAAGSHGVIQVDDPPQVSSSTVPSPNIIPDAPLDAMHIAEDTDQLSEPTTEPTFSPPTSKIPLFLPSPISSTGDPPPPDSDFDARIVDNDTIEINPASSGSQLSKRKKSFTGVYVLVPPAPDWVKRGKRKNPEYEAEKEARRRENEIVESSAIRISSSRLHERPCQWRDCEVVMNSADNLERHVKWHAEDMKNFSGSYPCLWDDCTRRFSTRGALTTHIKNHLKSPLFCAYDGCDESFRTPRELVRHHNDAHENGSLRCTVTPSTVCVPEAAPILKILPAYRVEPRDVRPAPISEERHKVLGPWVLRNIFGPVNLGPRRHNPTVPLRSMRRGGLDPVQTLEIKYRHDEYDFLARSPSRISRQLRFEDLSSAEVSRLVDEGLIIWPGEEDERGVSKRLQTMNLGPNRVPEVKTETTEPPPPQPRASEGLDS